MEIQSGRSDFLLAASRNDVATAADLLKRSFDVNRCSDEKGNTALHLSCESGHMEMVQLLVVHGAKVNRTNQDGMTPLHVAVNRDHVTIVRFLLDHGADHSIQDKRANTPLSLALNRNDEVLRSVLVTHSEMRRKRMARFHRERKMSPLHVAVKKNDVRSIQQILCKLQEASGCGKVLTNKKIHEPGRNGFTSLHWAVQYNSKDAAKLLIGIGADVNFPAHHSVTPLHVASRWGHREMVSLLLDEDAQMESCTKDKLTPLHCACRNGHSEVANLLLSKGARVLAKTKNLLSPLHMAVQGDHVGTCEMLLHYFANIDDVTNDFLTPLHVAAHCGNFNAAKFLLNSGCFVNASTRNGFTPLHVACKKNRLRIIQLLLRFDADIESASESGLTPLHVSSFLGHVDIIRHLLDSGAHIDCRNVRLESPIHLATRGGNVRVVELLLDREANVNSQAKELQTPLHYASHLNHVGLMELLMDRGALVDPRTAEGLTPVHLATVQDNEEAILCLMRRGADANVLSKRGFTALHLASKYDKKRSTRMLLAGGCDPNVRGTNELTPLLLASHYGCHDIVRLLLKYGADVNLTALNGYNSLHVSAKRNRLKIAEELLRWGVNVNTKSKNGFTPLHLACKEGHELMVQLLLNHGAEVNCPSKNGLTPLHLVARENRIGVAELLVLYKAEIDPQTLAGYTPLHTASHFGHVEMINFLLSHKADPNIQNKYGFSSLHQASQEGHLTIINLLLRFKANPNLLSSTGRSALSIASHLNYSSVVDALRAVTTKQNRTIQTDSDVPYSPCIPETMQEYDVINSEETSDKRNICSQIDSATWDKLPVLNGYTNQMASAGGKLEKRCQHSMDFVVDEKVLVDELRYTGESLQSPTNTTPSDLAIDGPSIESQFTDALEVKVEQRSSSADGSRTFPYKKNKKHRIFKRGKSEPSVTEVTGPSCELMHPSELPTLPLLQEDQAVASWVVHCRPAGKSFSKPVIIIMPHFTSLSNNEREVAIYESPNGLDWLEHFGPTVQDEKDCTAVLKPTFRGVNLRNDLYSRRLIGITSLLLPRYLLLVSRVSESRLPTCLPGSILRPPSDKHPVFVTIGQHDCTSEELANLSLAVQQIPRDFSMRGDSTFSCTPCISVKPVEENFKCPVTLTLSSFVLLKAERSGQLRLYVRKFDAHWYDVTDETEFSTNESSTVLTFPLRHGGWYIVTNEACDEITLSSLTSRLSLVPFHARFLLFCRTSPSVSGWMEFDLFCGTDDVIDGFVEEEINLRKVELLRSPELEVYNNTFQIFSLKGSLFETSSESPDRVFFQAFQRNCVTVSARMVDPHLLEKGERLILELFRGVITVSTLVPTESEVFFTVPVCQSDFSFNESDRAERVLWFPFIGLGPSQHREQLPPLANYFSSDDQTPVRIKFDEFKDTMKLPVSSEVIKYEYKDENLTESSSKLSDELTGDGSINRIETLTLSTYRAVYRFQDDNETKELVERRLCSVEILESVSKFPPGLRLDEVDLNELKFISSEKDVAEETGEGVPVRRKTVTKVYRAPKPRVSRTLVEGETFIESSYEEDLQALQDGSAVKCKKVKTVYIKPTSEQLFVNGALKNCRTENKTIRNEVEDYFLKLPNAFITPKFGAWTVNCDFKKSLLASTGGVEEVRGELHLEVTRGGASEELDFDLKLESTKMSKTDLIIKGPIECRVEKTSTSQTSEFGTLVKAETTTLTHVLPCNEVRMVAMSERKRIIEAEPLRVDIIENILELPRNYRDLDRDKVSYDTTASFDEFISDSGLPCRKKTFITRLTPEREPSKLGESGNGSRSFACPVECRTKITGMDRYGDADDAYEFNRTVETSLVEPVVTLTYNGDALPALRVESREIETDVRDVFMRLECGNVEEHARNCDVSVIVVPNAPASKGQDAKRRSLRRVVFDVKLKPPRVTRRRAEGEVQVRNKTEEFVKVSDDGKVKRHFKVVTSEHFKPITVTTLVDGKVEEVQRGEELLVTIIRENVFEMPNLALDVTGYDVDIRTSEDKFKECNSSSWTNKTSTKISLVPPESSEKRASDKTKEPEVVKEEFEFEDVSLDGSVNKHLVTIETLVIKRQDGDECSVVEQKITEKILEIPVDVLHLEDRQICSKTTDSWSRDETFEGVPTTKHVIKTRLYDKSKDFDYDPVSRNSKFQEELEGEIQTRTDVQEFVKFSSDAKIKHKIITRKFIRPVTVVRCQEGKRAPDVSVREDLIKVEIEEYAMELDDDLCFPDDCVSTIDNYTYVNYLPNGIPVNTEVTKVTAKLKKERKKTETVESASDDSQDGRNVKQKVSLVEDQRLLPDGSIVKTKTMTKDCFEVLKKINSKGEAKVCETLLKTEIKEFVMILPRSRIDLYASNCIIEVTSEFNKIAKKDPLVTKLTVTARVGLKVDSKHLVLSYNEVPKYSFAVSYDEAVVKEIIEYEERSNEPCIERTKRWIFTKSRPFHTFVLDDEGTQHRALTGSRIEEIKTIECTVQCLAEDAALGLEGVEIKSCSSEESNYYEDGVMNEKVRILCMLGRSDSERAKNSWVLEEKLEKRVDTLKEEDELCPNGSLKRRVTFGHRYFKVVNTVKLSPKLFPELETRENLLECNLVTVDVVISPCTIEDESDCKVEMETFNDWEVVSERTMSQRIEMRMCESAECTFLDAKLQMKKFESDKETFLFDETLVKWKTLTLQTFLTFSECRRQANDLETVKNRSILVRTDIFVVTLELEPEVVIDELRREFECLLSRDRSYLLAPDGSLCFKSGTKCVVKMALESNKLITKQSRVRKSSDSYTTRVLDDGTLIVRKFSTTSDVQPYYKIAKDQQLMLHEDVRGSEVEEVVLSLRPELKGAYNSSVPVTFTMRDETEISRSKTIKRRLVTCERGDEHGNRLDGRKVTLSGNLEVEEYDTEEQNDLPGCISMTKTWTKSLVKRLTDLHFKNNDDDDDDDGAPSITNKRLELYRESLKTMLRLPLGLLQSRKCGVSITFQGCELYDGVSYTRDLIADVELTMSSVSGLSNSITDDKVSITTDSNESGTRSRKSEVITTELLPDGSLGRKKVITTVFFKKRLETVYVDGIETTSREEEIPLETVEETHLLHLPFGMDEADLNDWDTEITESKDEGERQLDGLNVKYRTIHLRLAPRLGHVTGEIRQEVVEGEVHSKTEVSESQEALEDGSVLKKKVIKVTYTKPTTRVTSKNGRIIGLVTSEHVLGTEVEEIHLQLPPGHIEPYGSNLSMETTIVSPEETTGDSMPPLLKRKVIKMKVTLQDPQAKTTGAQTDLPFPLNSSKRVEGDLVSTTSFSEKTSTSDDGDRLISKTMTTRFFRPIVEMSISDGSISTASISEETTHFDVCETITVVSSGLNDLNDPDVIAVSTEEVFDEKNLEGVPVLRTVRTNKLYKVRGPSKATGAKREAGAEILPAVKSVYPQLFLDWQGVDDSLKVFSQVVENEPTRNVKIQEFVDILPDGTKVKRRVTETFEKRIITRRLAIEGDDARAILQGCLLGDSFLPTDHELDVTHREPNRQTENLQFPLGTSGVVKKLSKNSTRKRFATYTSFVSSSDHNEANDFFESF